MATTPLPVIPAVGDDRTLLLAFLDYHRAIVRRKAEGLGDEDLRVPLTGHPSPLTVGNVLKHLAWVEVKWARHVFAGVDYREIEEPWATNRGTDGDWEWDVSADSAETILAWYDKAVRLAGETYAAAADLDTLAAYDARDPQDPQDAATDDAPRDDRPRVSLRWILIHLLEEYARHAGHLDLLREQIDGAAGN